MNKRFADYFDVVDKKKARRRTGLGVFFGVVAGVTAGLLFAPQSGEETREDIVFALEEGACKTKEAAKTATTFTVEKAHEARHALAKALKSLDGKIRELRGLDEEFDYDELFDDECECECECEEGEVCELCKSESEEA